MLQGSENIAVRLDLIITTTSRTLEGLIRADQRGTQQLINIGRHCIVQPTLRRSQRLQEYCMAWHSNGSIDGACSIVRFTGAAIAACSKTSRVWGKISHLQLSGQSVICSISKREVTHGPQLLPFGTCNCLLESCAACFMMRCTSQGPHGCLAGFGKSLGLQACLGGGVTGLHHGIDSHASGLRHIRFTDEKHEIDAHMDRYRLCIKLYYRSSCWRKSRSPLARPNSPSGVTYRLDNISGKVLAHPSVPHCMTEASCSWARPHRDILNSTTNIYLRAILT